MDIKHPLTGRKQTEEHIKKRVEALVKNGQLKGKPTWNKGKRGLQVAWNKGLKGVNQQSDEAKEKHRIAGKKNRPIGIFHHTEETKRLLSEKSRLNNPRYWLGKIGMVGSLNPRYNPNLTTEDRVDRRNVAETIAWGEAVKERDNYTCQVCQRRGVYLHSHHKIPFAMSKAGRYNVTNGITICKECHTTFHREYGDNYNQDAFDRFKLTHGLIAAAS